MKEQGYAPAQFNLALMYERGTGIEQDYGRAYFWYALATEGSPGTTNLTREVALQARDNVARHLSADERQRLERAIRDWLPRGDSFDLMWDAAQ